jgi:hypothetical protein
MEDWDEVDDDELDLDSFTEGDAILVETRTGLEVGLFVGVSMQGLLLRATHRAAVGSEEDEGPLMVPLESTILTFIPWRRIEKIESKADWDLAQDARVFLKMLSQVDDETDLAAMIELEMSEGEE